MCWQVGTSMSMSFRRYKAGLLSKVLVRAAKLFLIGLATQVPLCTHFSAH